MVELIHLDEIRIGKNNESFFIIGEKNKLVEKNVVIYGTGKEAYMLALKLQVEYGTRIQGFINVDKNLIGKRKFCGKPIISVKEALDKKLYIVVALGVESYVNEILWYLKIKKYFNYAITVIEKFHVFENDIIRHVVAKEMNAILCGNKQIQDIVRPVLNVGGEIKRIWYDLSELCWTTMWSNHLYEWYYSCFGNETKAILEVGPGKGLFSSFIKSISDSKIDLIMFDINNESCEYRDMENCDYPFNQFDKYYGVIESDHFVLHKAYDIIVLTEVMEHFVTNPVTIIKKITSCLKLDGYVLMSTPNWGHVNIYDSYRDIENYSGLENYKSMYIGHTYQYTYEELKDIFDECGLVIMKYMISDSNNHNFMLQKVKQ